MGGGAHEYIGVEDAAAHNGFEYQTSAVVGTPYDCCGGLVANRLHWCGGCGLGEGMCNGSGHQTTTMNWWLGHHFFGRLMTNHLHLHESRLGCTRKRV